MYYYSTEEQRLKAECAHLTNMQELAYRRLRGHYAITEKPIDLDLKKVARLIRNSEKDILVVLNDFFIKTEHGWKNEELEKQIEKAKNFQRKQSSAGKASAQKRGNHGSTTVQPEGNTGQPLVTGNLVTCDSVTCEESNDSFFKEKNTKKKKIILQTKPDEVEESDWQELMVYVKEKKKPITPRVFAEMVEEATKANLTVAQMVQYCCKKGWARFKAEWIDDSKKPPPKEPPKPFKPTYFNPGNAPPPQENVDIMGIYDPSKPAPIIEKLLEQQAINGKIRL